MLDNIGTPVQRHQPVAQRGRADLAGRRRRSSSRSSEDHAPTRRATCASCARRCAQTYPEHDVLLPRARHLDAGPRTSASPAPIDVQVVGAVGQRGRRRSRSREELAARDREGPGRGRRAPRAGAAACRSSASTSTARWPAARAHRARRRERPARLAVVELAGRAELLARPEARRAVPRRRADAAVRDRLASRRSATTPLSTAARATPQLLVERRHDLARRPARRTSRTTTSRAPSTCRPTSTGPTSARSPTRVDADRRPR